MPYEALAIFAIVTLNAVMGYVQEAGAEASWAKLRAMSAAEATVLRDGEARRIAAVEACPRAGESQSQASDRRNAMDRRSP